MSLINDMLRDLDREAPKSGLVAREPSHWRGEPRRLSITTAWLVALAAFALVYYLLVEKNLLGWVPPRSAELSSEMLLPMHADPLWLETTATKPVAPTTPTALVPPSPTDEAIADAEAFVFFEEREKAQEVEQVKETRATIAAEEAPERASPPSDRVSPLPQAEQLDPPKAVAPPVTNPRLAAESARAASVRRTPADQDVELAHNLREQGLAAWEASAWQWLRNGRSTDMTLVALADVYAAAGQAEDLAALEHFLQTRQNSLLRYVQARQLWLAGDGGGAVEVLAQQVFSGAAEAARLRTLAGFHQRMGDFAAAMPLYRQLVRLDPMQVNDWLGLAAAADAQRRTDLAMQAYQQVLNLRHPNPRVMQFARQRLQDLSASGG